MNTRRFTPVVLLIIALSATAFAAAEPKQQGSWRAWGESPEALFLTQSERTQFETLLSQSEADTFIRNYWAQHGNGFHEAVLARVAAADKYFPLNKLKGSETQRGRVFIILGAPNRQQINRRDVGSYGIGETGTRGSVADKAMIGTVWTYKSDRLPKDLGVAELVVKFQTDVSRGYEVIENPGLVEPYLTKATGYLVEHWNATATVAATQMPAPQQQAKSAAASLLPSDDAVWNATSLNGAILTAEPFISPTDKPFYAVSFYLPKSFAAPDDVVLAAIVRDAGGNQVISARANAKPAAYGAAGDRFADAAFAVPPGHYTAAFALASADGTVLAGANREIDVFAPDYVGASRLLLTSRIETLEKQGELDPFTFLAMKYAVKGDQRFLAADKIGFFVFLSNPTVTPEPSFAMKLIVKKDGKVIDNGTWTPIQLSQSGPHTYLLATQFDPLSFSPGRYALELRIRDTKADKESDAFKGYVKSAEFEVVAPAG